MVKGEEYLSRHLHKRITLSSIHRSDFLSSIIVHVNDLVVFAQSVVEALVEFQLQKKYSVPMQYAIWCDLC